MKRLLPRVIRSQQGAEKAHSMYGTSSTQRSQHYSPDIPVTFGHWRFHQMGDNWRVGQMTRLPVCGTLNQAKKSPHYLWTSLAQLWR